MRRYVFWVARGLELNTDVLPIIPSGRVGDRSDADAIHDRNILYVDVSQTTEQARK